MSPGDRVAVDRPAQYQKADPLRDKPGTITAVSPDGHWLVVKLDPPMTAQPRYFKPEQLTRIGPGK